MPTSFLQNQMFRTTRWIALTAMILALVGCDQGLKYYAVQNWKGQPDISFAGGMFKIQYAENPGAFLSLLGNFSPEIRFWTLTVANGVLLAGLMIYLLWPSRQHALIFFALGLVLAGGIGNLIDRIRINAVIDFFNLGVGGLRTGIFNIADMAITAGFLLMLPLVYYGDTLQPAEQESSSTPATEG